MTGKTKAWIGQFGEIGHPYTHPSNKQCSYSYTHPSTKQCNYSYTHPSTKQCDAAAGNHSHSQYALATTVATLQNKITNLEGSVDMAKLVYSKGVSLSSYDNSTTVTYKASFVRIKIAAYIPNSNAACCGTACVDIPGGGSAWIVNNGVTYNITYSTDGVVTISKGSGIFTLEFYNY